MTATTPIPSDDSDAALMAQIRLLAQGAEVGISCVNGRNWGVSWQGHGPGSARFWGTGPTLAEALAACLEQMRSRGLVIKGLA